MLFPTSRAQEDCPGHKIQYGWQPCGPFYLHAAKPESPLYRHAVTKTSRGFPVPSPKGPFDPLRHEQIRFACIHGAVCRSPGRCDDLIARLMLQIGTVGRHAAFDAGKATFVETTTGSPVPFEYRAVSVLAPCPSVLCVLRTRIGVPAVYGFARFRVPRADLRRTSTRNRLQ